MLLQKLPVILAMKKGRGIPLGFPNEEEVLFSGNFIEN